MRKFLTTGMVMACAGLWTFAVYYSQLMLKNAQVWEPEALSLAGLSMKGIEAQNSRFVLRNFALNGGPAYYRQRIKTKSFFTPEKIQARFRHSAPTAWTLIGFNYSREGFEAIRISNSQVRPSEHVYIERNEKIRWRRPIAIPPVVSGVLTISAKDGKILADIDDKKVYEAEGSFHQGPVIAEVTSHAQIMDIKVTDAKEEHSLSFRPRMNLIGLFLLNVFLFGLFTVMKSGKRALLFLTVLGVLWISFDHFALSRRYYRWNIREQAFEPVGPHSINYEKLRSRFFSFWAAPFLEEVPRIPPFLAFSAVRKIGCEKQECREFQTFPARLPLGKTGVLYIGGSTSYGYGASSSEKVCDVVLYHLLKKKNPDTRFVSFSVNHQLRRHEDLMEARELLARARPRVLVLEIDIGIAVEKNIETLIGDAMKLGTKVMFVRAPSDVTMYTPGAVKRIQDSIGQPLQAQVKIHYPGAETESVLKRITEKYPVIYVDARAPFVRPENYLEAMLFWDIVHLSDTGHELFGETMAPAVSKLLSP